ncbi:hypothetical protein BC827DRAFT_1162590, partial [Russula dissimulans]
MKAAEQSSMAPLLLGSPVTVGPHFAGYYELYSLIEHGLGQDPKFVERQLDPGEARRSRVCFSSGTTVKPKAVEISHYAIIGNLI